MDHDVGVVGTGVVDRHAAREHVDGDDLGARGAGAGDGQHHGGAVGEGHGLREVHVQLAQIGER